MPYASTVINLGAPYWQEICVLNKIKKGHLPEEPANLTLKESRLYKEICTPCWKDPADRMTVEEAIECLQRIAAPTESDQA